MRRHPATYLLCSSALLIEYSSINVAPNLKRVPFDFRGKSKLLPQRLAFTCFHYPLQIFGFEQVNGRNCMMLSIVSVPGTFNSLNQLMLTQSWNAGTLSIWVLRRRKLRLREIKQLGQRYNIGIPGLNPSYWDSKVHALPLPSFASLARSDFAAANSPGQGSNLEAILNIRTALNWQHLLSVSFTTVFPEWGRDADTDIVDAQEIFSKQVNTFLFTWALTVVFLKHLRFGFNYGGFFWCGTWKPLLYFLNYALKEMSDPIVWSSWVEWMSATQALAAAPEETNNRTNIGGEGVWNTIMFYLIQKALSWHSEANWCSSGTVIFDELCLNVKLM